MSVIWGYILVVAAVFLALSSIATIGHIGKKHVPGDELWRAIIFCAAMAAVWPLSAIIGYISHENSKHQDDYDNFFTQVVVLSAVMLVMMIVGFGLFTELR